MKYDYQNQAWIDNDGRYVRCGHPDSMVCACFGRIHEGTKALGKTKLVETGETVTVYSSKNELFTI